MLWQCHDNELDKRYQADPLHTSHRAQRYWGYLDCHSFQGKREILNISELYGYDDKDMNDSAYPIRYHNISKAQKTDAKLQQKLVSHKDYTLDTFVGAIKTIV